MAKCALIVDDSRTARAVLRRILETHNIDVDTAESAEAALDYLAEYRPDVIFMDHMMPGMDGFEAVSAIKKNPRTATIPIMMYTSKKGDVYVGQARALGAVGVLPKEVEPVEVSKVLESLNIVSRDGSGSNDEPAAVGVTPSGSYPVLENLDADIQLLLEDLFEQQRTILRRDFQKTSDAIADKVADRLRRWDDVPGALPPEPETRMPLRGIAALLIAGGVIAIVAIQNVRLQSELGASKKEIAALADARTLQLDRTAGAEEAMLSQLDNIERRVESSRTATLDVVAWALNRSGQYPFGEEPLGDARIADAEELIDRLQAIEFQGQVIFATHVGEHCLTLMPDGYALADPGMPADLCDVRGFSSEEALDISSRQSVGMANLISSVDARTGGAISLSVVPYGASDPILPYPADPASVTAGEWNAIADVNNRIEVTLLPDAPLP